jgi:hypothetical protein
MFDETFQIIRESNKKNIQNYYGSGLCPSSGILKTRKHSFLETGIFLPSLEGRKRFSFRNVF